MNETIRTYLNEDRLPLPFCPGCGHAVILKALDRALVSLALKREDVVIVTDIGCVGLSDKYFHTHAFHGLHGRSITYASGLALAQPEKNIIVLTGDGGVGIGGHHLINAARRNMDITVLVFNNFNYGMTGGEHSVTTPIGSHTVTTHQGQIEQPMDICGTAAVNGGSFIARKTSFDKDLDDTIAAAIQHTGFALVDIWELCTSYFAVNNAFGKKNIQETLDSLHFKTGILHKREGKPYLALYREKVEGTKKKGGRLSGMEITHSSLLSRPFAVTLAGAAGEKIISAAKLFGQGGVRSGLFVTQRDDYPVTVKTGHSRAELILSPEPILYSGMERPDVLIILFEEGLRKVSTLLPELTSADKVYINARLGPVSTAATVMKLQFDHAGPLKRRSNAYAVMALAELLRHEALYPVEAFLEALQARKRFAADSLAAVKASEGVLEP